MQYPQVNELFRYYGDLNFAREVIEQQLVYCPKASEFNDPFDGDIPFDIDTDASEFIASVHRNYTADGYSWSTIRSEIMDNYIAADGTLRPETVDRIKKVAEQYRQHNTNVGLLCLSENPLSILMWSHYGNKHKGICIGFTRSAGSVLGDDDACNPVAYSESYPMPRFSQIHRNDASLTSDVLFTKAAEWAYEKEWRLISDKGNAPATLPGTISRVILGCRADGDEIDQIMSAVTQSAPPDGHLLGFKVHHLRM